MATCGKGILGFLVIRESELTVLIANLRYGFEFPSID
jgi:hypothetical protein